MESGAAVNVAIAQGLSILQLVATEDQPLTASRDTFLILKLPLYVQNGAVGRESDHDGFSHESLQENLHAGDLRLVRSDARGEERQPISIA